MGDAEQSRSDRVEVEILAGMTTTSQHEVVKYAMIMSQNGLRRGHEPIYYDAVRIGEWYGAVRRETFREDLSKCEIIASYRDGDEITTSVNPPSPMTTKDRADRVIDEVILALGKCGILVPRPKAGLGPDESFLLVWNISGLVITATISSEPYMNSVVQFRAVNHAVGDCPICEFAPVCKILSDDEMIIELVQILIPPTNATRGIVTPCEARL